MSERPPAPRWLIGITVMLTTVMVVLDITIVNVTLPHMMGALGATSDQITWVLTAYIVTNAIFIPLTGFLSELWGRKRLMIVSISGFVATSALCGQAGTLAEMVLFGSLAAAMAVVAQGNHARLPHQTQEVVVTDGPDIHGHRTDNLA